MNGYEIQNKGDEATIYIYEQIGEDWFGEGLTAKSFAEELKGLKNVKNMHIRINSIGGSVFEARAMASLLRDHPSKKSVSIDGVCASAASYIACIDATVSMAEDALYMIHPPSGFAMGPASEMRKTAELLDTVQEGMLDVYTKRTGMDRKEMKSLVDAETWMTPTMALDYGFIDEIAESMKLAAKADLSKLPKNKMPYKVPDAAKEKIEIVDSRGTPILDAMKERLKNQQMKVEMGGYRL